MNEISVILKNNTLVTVEEFRILDRYTCSGKLWTVIRRDPYVVKLRAVEYIFDPETLLLFQIMSQNIFATWDTDFTKNLGPNDEYCIGNSTFIRPYGGSHL
jgi:hypothetical protein